jgi:DNA-binding response OmpR family regulator
MTILAVDDEETILGFFSILLQREGFNVITAPNGAAALSKLKGHKVALVILDLMMPGTGGYEVLKEMQSEYKDIPIFICTSRALDDGTIEMLRQESNVHSFWTKPVDQDRFRSEIHTLLGTERAPNPWSNPSPQ